MGRDRGEGHRKRERGGGRKRGGGGGLVKHALLTIETPYRILQTQVIVCPPLLSPTYKKINT